MTEDAFFDVVEFIENSKRKKADEHAQINSSAQKEALANESSKSTLRDILGGASNMAYGAAHEIGRIPTGILNAIGFKVTNPMPLQDEAMFSVGRAIPPIALGIATSGMGNAIGGLSSVSKYSPALLKAFLKSKGIIPSMVKTGLSGAAYEGIADYEDRAGGALTGLAIGSAGGALAPAIGSIGNVLKSGTPNMMARKILERLGHGAADVEENSQKFISESLRPSALSQLNKAKELYKDPLNFARSKKVSIDDIESIFKNSNVKPEDLLYSARNSSSEKAYERFIKHPTLDKVHWLQSNIGKDTVKFTDPKTISDWTKLRENLLRYIENNLSESSSSLANKYKTASDVFKKEYIPYKESRAAKALLEKRGKAFPESRVDMYKLFSDADKPTIKILNDLGIEGKDRLLYSRFGKLANDKRIAEKLAQATDLLENSHLKSISTPAFEGSIGGLEEALYKYKMMKLIGGIGATGLAAGIGAGAHKHVPFNIFSE